MKRERGGETNRVCVCERGGREREMEMENIIYLVPSLNAKRAKSTNSSLALCAAATDLIDL